MAAVSIQCASLQLGNFQAVRLVPIAFELLLREFGDVAVVKPLAHELEIRRAVIVKHEVR